jgi:NAD(P)H dehydrogenase (quinone)
MFPITGITGKVGGTLARKLLEAEQPVCTVVRDAAKGQAWANKGA